MFPQEGSPIYSSAKTLEEFFYQLLEKWLPAYASDESVRMDGFDETEEEDDGLGEPPHKRGRKSVND